MPNEDKGGGVRTRLQLEEERKMKEEVQGAEDCSWRSKRGLQAGATELKDYKVQQVRGEKPPNKLHHKKATRETRR